MPESTFEIDSPEAARRFQSFLNQYYVFKRRKEAHDPVPGDLLANVYILTQTDRANSRLFSAVIDFELTYLSMMFDIHGAVDVWVTRFGPAQAKPASVLDDFPSFAGKLEILYNMSSFALRCRAFWDKAMGILFLIYDDANYQKFAKSTSRKGFFRKRAATWPPLSPYILESLKDVDVVDLTAQAGLPDLALTPQRRPRCDSDQPFHDHQSSIVDTLDTVRTAEAHGAGTLRKWSFSMLPLHESKDAWLINHWNIANRFTHALRRTLLDIAKPI